MPYYDVPARRLIDCVIRVKADSPEEATYMVDVMIVEQDGIPDQYVTNDEWITSAGVEVNENHSN